MTDVNFANMSTKELVEFYNRHNSETVKRFSDRATAIKRCEKLFESIKESQKVESKKSYNGGQRPVMSASLKLDRTIMCVDTGETWKNAYQMWVAHKDWMTSAQQDRLTSQLYEAAKRGERKVLNINGREFQLVNVTEIGE